jgi:hypothetical protein
MNAEALINRLERGGVIFPVLVANVPLAEARWKPGSGAWSILEIARHMLDEEIEDFRQRLRLTLESPGTAWPANDPEAWARDRKYNEADLAETARAFVEERRASIAWLRSLRNPDWTMTYVHPRAGAMQAGMLLTCWAAHDALHVRQIAKRMFELAGRDGDGYSTDYAGTWGA